MNLVNTLVAALIAAVLLAAILVVCFPPPKPHPGNHRGNPAPAALDPDATGVLILPGVDAAARAGQPQAWVRGVGRVTVPDSTRSYLPPRHARVTGDLDEQVENLAAVGA